MPKIPLLTQTQTPSGFVQGRPQSSVPDFSGLTRGLQAVVAGNEQQRAEREQMERDIRREAEEQQRQREAADKATAQEHYLATLDTLADSFEEHAAGIADGSIDKTSARAKWAEKTQALIGLAADKIPPQHRQLMTQRLHSAAGRHERLVGRAVLKRDRTDTRAAIGASIEYAARMATTDYAGARHLAMQTLQDLGPFGGMDAAEIQKAGQTWLESAAFTRASDAVSRARTSVAALGKARQFIGGMTDLDPQRRVQLEDRIQGYEISLAQRAEIEANRRERQAAAHERRAATAASAALALMDKGGELAPEYVDRVNKATAGTPWAAVVRSAMHEQKAVGAFASQPLAKQRAAIEQIDAKIAREGRSPELDKQRERLARINAAAIQDAQKDPIEAFVQRGGEAPPALDVTTLDTTLAGLPARAQHAGLVGQWAGRDVSPLFDHEAVKLADQLNALAPPARAERIAALSQSMNGRQAQALAMQIDKKDRALALAMAAGTSRTPDGRNTSELILRGAQAKRDKLIKDDSQAEIGTRASIAKYIGDSLNGKAREDVMEAAHFIAMAGQLDGAPDPQRAVRLAVGGDIIEHNGTRIPVPPGIADSATLRAALAGPAAKAVITQSTDGNFYAGGSEPISAEVFVQLLPDAQLTPAGQGKYFVRSGGDFVRTKQGRRVVVDLQ